MEEFNGHAYKEDNSSAVNNEKENQVDVEQNAARFLGEMKLDYPEIADVIEKRSGEWISAVDSFTGVDGAGQEILDTIVYVSSEDEQKFCQGIAVDMKDDLDSDPEAKIVFARFGGENRSETYFQDIIMNELPEDYHNRIVAPSSNDEHYNAVRDSATKFIYHIDDSANSGQHLQTALISSMTPVLEGEKRDVEFKSHMLGVTEQAVGNIEPFIENNLHAKLVETSLGKKIWKSSENGVAVEINAPKTPDLEQVADNLIADGRLKEEDRKKVLFNAHHGRNFGTLMLFNHRLLQDNVPDIFVGGKNTEYYKGKISPLFEGFEDVNDYK